MARRYSTFYFLRSYIALAAAILIIAVALDSLLAWLIPAESDNVQRYAPSLALINELLIERAAGETAVDATSSTSGAGVGTSNGVTVEDEQIAVAFAALAPHLYALVGAELQLFHITDFAGQDTLLEELQTGETVSLFDPDDREILYRRLNESDFILSLGPIERAVDAVDNLESLLIVSYYLLVAVIVYLWVRPFYRDLGALRAAASRFGRDDFASRVQVGPKSSILPVAESFNRMAERIQYLVTAHQDLTNAVSHELRTPLARFKFSMEMLGKIDDPKKKAAYLASMKTDVEELEELIDEMLTYARLSEENLQLTLNSVVVDNWLRLQVSQYPPEPIPIDYRFTAHEGDDDNEAAFNADMLARALHNILRNCLRYASRQLTVEAELSTETVNLRIADDGPGIPEDKRASVFEPFARLDTSRDRQSGGYGLGLAIARRILQRHGGSIHVEANNPTGARFVLSWPRRQPTQK